MNNIIQWDTIYVPIRGFKTKIREVLHRPNLEIDSTLSNKFKKYQNQKLIRYKKGRDTSNKLVIIRKSLLEIDSTFFKIIEGDSISRGGHIIRKIWDSSKVPIKNLGLN